MEKAELQQLAARAEQGDSAAWDALYREIGAIAASVCRKYNMSAEDAARLRSPAGWIRWRGWITPRAISGAR